jgi:gamma-glutamyltranspeptidase/glutathione hydrolase
MKIAKYFRKTLTITAILLTTVGGIISLDIVISGSVYHPLTYLYKILSWWACRDSSLRSCHGPSDASVATVSGKQGLVVATQHEASQVGLQVLKQGGNAIDAAVAVGYALAVTDPCCGNLGGGGFMLIHLAQGKDIFLNFREKAPLAASPSMYLNERGNVVGSKSQKGYLSVGVPGTVRGLDYALTKYGTLSRASAISPAIQLAQKGFVLREGDVRMLQANQKKFADPNVAAIFLKEGKAPYQVGDRLVQEDLAQTLKLIAAKGSDAFYRGQIARKIVQASQENGGLLSLKDFAAYTPVEQEPVQCSYRGYQVVSAPPPGGGITLCQMLNILEGYPLKSRGWHSAESVHWMLSAMLYAYADRNTYLADPNFVKIPVQKLLSKQYAAQIRQKIPQNSALAPEPLYQDVVKEGTNTTHYSVVDRQGNAVAVTYTINSNFGAAVIASDTGFFLNNEMDDFTSKPGVANQFGLVQGQANLIEPGKRPLSSMSPTVVTKKGQVVLVTGSPGGSTIPTTVLQVLINRIDYQMNVDEAVNSPRIHYQGLPNLVMTEPYALRSKVFLQLWERGYRVIPFFNWGAAESIAKDEKKGVWQGANDSRKSAGEAVGF